MPRLATPQRIVCALVLLLGLVVNGAADAPPAFLVRPYLQLPGPDRMTVMWETSQALPGRVEYGLNRDLDLVASDRRPPVKLHEVALTDLLPATTYYYRVRSGPLVSEVYHFRTAPPH